jgi:hypothetical protein
MITMTLHNTAAVMAVVEQQQQAVAQPTYRRAKLASKHHTKMFAEPSKILRMAAKLQQQ